MDYSRIQGLGVARLSCPLQAGGVAPARVALAALEPGQRCPEKRVVELACQVQADTQQTRLLWRRCEFELVDEPGAARTHVLPSLSAECRMGTTADSKYGINTVMMLRVYI